jgi:mono/diheme cytochrome c family protein
VRRLLPACLCLALLGCERAMHDMYDQPKYKPLRPSPLFEDGNSSRPRVPRTLPYSSGDLAGASSGRSGTDAVQARRAAERASRMPYAVTMQLLRRGQERFNIYCAVCHSPLGDGDGMIVRRGFPAPPSYHIERLRSAPDRHFYEVITQGYGIMYPYADRVAPQDRWAIVAYIRALQLSQNAPLSEAPKDGRQSYPEGAAHE